MRRREPPILPWLAIGLLTALACRLKGPMELMAWVMIILWGPASLIFILIFAAIMFIPWGAKI